MNKKDYYINKIQYALAKIDFAKNRLNNEKDPKNIISTLFYVLQSRKEVDIETLMRITKFSRDEVIKGLQYLNAIGLADWRGYEIEGKNRTIKYTEQKNFSEYVKELEEKMTKAEGKIFSEKKKPNKVREIEDVKDDEDEWVEVKYNPDVILKIKKSKLKELM